MAKIAPERPLYGLWRPKCRHVASPQAFSIHVESVPRDAGGAATPCPPCLAHSGRNIYPQPLRRHTQQGPLWPGVWIQGSVRTDHHCFRGLNPPKRGPYQVFLTLWHLSVCLHPPTLSESSGLLFAKNGQSFPSLQNENVSMLDLCKNSHFYKLNISFSTNSLSK